MTGFGSFDNSTCKRVPDLLQPGDLRLGEVVIKRVAVVKLGVNSGSGDGGSLLVQNSSKTTKKFFTFDVSTSIRGLHQKKLVLGLLLPVLGAIS